MSYIEHIITSVTLQHGIESDTLLGPRYTSGSDRPIMGISCATDGQGSNESEISHREFTLQRLTLLALNLTGSKHFLFYDGNRHIGKGSECRVELRHVASGGGATSAHAHHVTQHQRVLEGLPLWRFIYERGALILIHNICNVQLFNLKYEDVSHIKEQTTTNNN
ncbi:hypothetical protein KGM_207407 [Danaus plexippus plexippus]|uniref:Uncharacterized protein n=1 Tax=Danaus plexippus plexippus TaxID=278856 RepID=A0A212FNB0_DANPL|nr:hypothetical protein KGM_207407 [Danaus plexippus plexippus]